MADTVIVGAGIIGVCTAYYLSEHQAPETIHLVEASELFASASGYAGGFLARDWFRPDVAELGALSYDEHKALAAKYDGAARWSYATSTSLSYHVPEPAGSTSSGSGSGEDWLLQGTSRANAAPGEKKELPADQLPTWLRRRAGDSLSVIANDGSTAQLDSLHFCQFLLAACRERGVQLHQPARVVSVGTDAEGTMSHVVVDAQGSRTTLPCARLLIAAGCWTPQVFEELFPSRGGEAIPITNLSGHSVVVRVPAALTDVPAQGQKNQSDTPQCHALYIAGSTLDFCPEMYSRLGGTLYMAGLNSSTAPLPARSADSKPQPEKLAQLLQTCKKALGTGHEVEVLRAGLCHRPVTPWGLPLVTRWPDEKLAPESSGQRIRTRPGAAGGVYVASGHGPWGITMAPGTGIVLAELMQGRPLSADVSKLGLYREKAAGHRL